MATRMFMRHGTRSMARTLRRGSRPIRASGDAAENDADNATQAAQAASQSATGGSPREPPVEPSSEPPAAPGTPAPPPAAEAPPHEPKPILVTTVRATATASASAPPASSAPVTAEATRKLASHALWQPSDDVTIDENALPPKGIYAEALSHLLITLSPKVQRASYTAESSSTALIEPTLGLYCPFEGGEYVIDSTVRAMAREIDADVVVIDAAQIAAGDAGVFGHGSGLVPTAGAIQLPRNPLHMPDPNAAHSLAPSAQEQNEEEGEEVEEESGSGRPVLFQAQVSLQPRSLPQVLRATSSASRSRGPAAASSERLFFDQFVKLDPKNSGLPGRPRIIYVRDFALLAPYTSSWLPSLVESVVSRRRTTASGKSGAQLITIVFGLTPALSGPPPVALPSGAPGGPAFLHQMRMRLQRMDDQRTGADALHGRGASDKPTPEPVDVWGEGTDADRARERRTRLRLRRWKESNFDLPSQLPQFSLTGGEEGESGSRSGPRIAGGQPIIALDSPLGFLGRLINGGEGGGGPQRRSAAEESPSYFRASFLVPRARSLEREKESRLARRRTINELLMRMGVGSIGGRLEPLQQPLPEASMPAEASASMEGPTVEAEAQAEAPVTLSTDGANATPAPVAAAGIEEALEATEASSPKPAEPTATEQPAEPIQTPAPTMNEAWGNTIESWPTVKEIADRALGSVVSSQIQQLRTRSKSSANDWITVSWDAVRASWAAQRIHRETRAEWMREAVGKASEEDEDGEAKKPRDEQVDEVVERLKRDGSLNAHEQRLLGCIVNTASMPTTFSQVHLPPHTIDSVRTLVSLPLLHPTAFTSGVLKQHTMTGALLFGPPGTGKTLLVRALARESGARMMIVTPSDVMDMYVGEGEKLVRAVFTIARRLSPCVVFLDEIDALFGARVSSRGTGGAIAHRGVITEFMQEMDGLKTREDANVIVIGATNRPFDLDDAVLRRLPRRLLVDLPGPREREEILKIMLSDEVLDADVDLTALAKRTESFSGSDLKHLCVAAALDAVKEVVRLPWRTTTEQRLIEAPIPGTEALSSTSSENVVGASSEPAATTSIESATTEPQTPESAAAQLSAEASSTPATDSSEASKSTTASTSPSKTATTPTPPRILAARHFAKALSEITPSASESSGSLTELRKWNSEFGENGRAKQRMWGGNFGFMTDLPGSATAAVPAVQPSPSSP